MKPTESIPISSLRLDGGTQPRAALDFSAVDDYADAMADGAKFPPVVVYYDSENYWLADGFHRVKAAWQAGLETIHAEVRQGTLEEAQWHSFSANKSNGLRRSNEDKQRAVKAALQHPYGVTLSDRQISIHVGVAQSTVTEWRKKLESSYRIDKIATRTATRKGRHYQQHTANIGRRPLPAEDPREPAALSPPARSQPEASPSPSQAHIREVLNAVQQILACPLTADEFYACLAQQPEQANLIETMEKLDEFIHQVLAQARRAPHCV